MKTTVRLAILAAIAAFIATPAYADNCSEFADCGGVMTGTAAAAGLAVLISLILNLIPVVGDIKGLMEAVIGRDLITWQKLTPLERILGAVPLVGDVAKLAKLGKLIDEAIAAGKLGDIVANARQTGQLGELVDAVRSGGALEKVTGSGYLKTADFDHLVKSGKLSLDEARAGAAKTGWRDVDGKWIHHPNDGFSRPPTLKKFEVGEEFDRFGEGAGSFAAPTGTSFEARAIPDRTAGYYRYRVTEKGAKELEALEGPTGSWFGMSGGGAQFKFETKIDRLLDGRYIEFVRVNTII